MNDDDTACAAGSAPPIYHCPSGPAADTSRSRPLALKLPYRLHARLAATRFDAPIPKRRSYEHAR